MLGLSDNWMATLIIFFLWAGAILYCHVIQSWNLPGNYPRSNHTVWSHQPDLSPVSLELKDTEIHPIEQIIFNTSHTFLPKYIYIYIYVKL